MSNDNSIFFGLLLLAVAITIYLIPTIVARSREHTNATSITVLNVLLGWSVVGWVIALVWACSAQPEVAQSKQLVEEDNSPQSSKSDSGSPEMKACPYCAEPIRLQAIKCKHCGSDLSPAAKTTEPEQATN